MASFTTIDAAGRVVIPKRLREALRLFPNTRLRVVEDHQRVVLEPVEEAPVLIERDGIVLVGGELAEPALNVRKAREDRLDELVHRVTRRRHR